MANPCPICERRRRKRFCPGVSRSRWAGRGKGETICAQCCGEQREVTIDCPVDCSYLVAAHRYEADRPTSPSAQLAFPDVVVDQDFLQENQPLLVGLSWLLVRYAGDHSEVRDADVMAALDALARSYQTLESGLYYEQKPEGLTAQAVSTALQGYLNQFAQEQQQRQGTSLRPVEALRALVFLRRLGQVEGNGRPLSRRYLNFLRAHLPADAPAPTESRLILPGS